MASAMEKKRKDKWKRKSCGCIKTELPNAGKVIIHCSQHYGSPTKRLACYLDGNGIVIREGDPPTPKVVEPKPQPGAEFVYVARIGDSIKIGYSKNPEHRVAELQAELVGFVSGSRELEQHLHYLLRKHRLRNEWYRNDPEVQLVVNKVLSQK